MSEAAAKRQGGIKDIAVGRSDIFRLHPDDIHIKPGWNSRDFDDPANAEHIEQLAKSISEVGVKEPLTVYWEDSKAWISDGECRLRAARMAIEKYGVEIRSIPVKTEGSGASEADRLFSQIVRNSGKGFTPFEQGKVFKRLLDLGWSEKEIADKAGRSIVWVRDLLGLQAAPESVKTMVRAGEVSATLAASTMKKSGGDGVKAERTLKTAVETAKASGKARATKKHVKASEPTKARPKREKRPDPHAELRELFGKAMIEEKDRDIGLIVVRMTTESYDRIRELIG